MDNSFLLSFHLRYILVLRTFQRAAQENCKLLKHHSHILFLFFCFGTANEYFCVCFFFCPRPIQPWKQQIANMKAHRKTHLKMLQCFWTKKKCNNDSVFFFRIQQQIEKEVKLTIRCIFVERAWARPNTRNANDAHYDLHICGFKI